MPPTDLNQLERIFMPLPANRISSSPFQKSKRLIDGLFKSSLAANRAKKLGVPGMVAWQRITKYGIKLMMRTSSTLPFAFRLYLSLFPMDSTRYFEFEYSQKKVTGQNPSAYLDVSSPRLLPCMLVEDWKKCRASILNPDKLDIQQTEHLFRALGIADRCAFKQSIIEDANFAPDSFDVITSISVIEHIRDDKKAIAGIWKLLRPNGRMIITVPCAKRASYQSSNINHYGLVHSDERGEFFVEYLYDLDLLKDRIFSVTGFPENLEIYGEKQKGFLQSLLLSRETQQEYHYWREPLTMAENFKMYDSISNLPGEGVAAMTFIKHA